MDESTVPSDVLSLRSYASSIISTGTKTSIETFTQPHPHQHTYPPDDTEPTGIDVHLNGHRNYRITARPGSILSISSFDPPCPPYENPPSTNASTTTLAPVPSSPSTSGSRSGFHPPSPTPSLPPLTTSLPPTLSPLNPSPTSLLPTLSTRPPSPTSPTLPDPTTLSHHYSLVVRTIDANHRAELAQTRHAIDAAYRVALRAADADVERAREDAAVVQEEARREVEALRAALGAKDAEMARVRAEAAREAAVLREGCEAEVGVVKRGWMREVEALRAGMEAWLGVVVQRARNEVEDLWEGRWRERVRVQEEEMARRVEGARAEEREGWLRELGRRWPGREREWEAVGEAVGGGGVGKGA